MPRQRIGYSRTSRQFPDDFPEGWWPDATTMWAPYSAADKLHSHPLPGSAPGSPAIGGTQTLPHYSQGRHRNHPEGCDNARPTNPSFR